MVTLSDSFVIWLEVATSLQNDFCKEVPMEICLHENSLYPSSLHKIGGVFFLFLKYVLFGLFIASLDSKKHLFERKYFFTWKQNWPFE